MGDGKQVCQECNQRVRVQPDGTLKPHRAETERNGIPVVAPCVGGGVR